MPPARDSRFVAGFVVLSASSLLTESLGLALGWPPWTKAEMRPNQIPGRLRAGEVLLGNFHEVGHLAEDVWSLRQSRPASCGSRVDSNSCRVSKLTGLTM
jgi:hypothetical protein